mmetsp:Transcript_14110/g.33895  ORF Transcript_14110/g.33895 Transcript_14110/m.33895 type:complete len:262 (+) Transcript_14110:1223-2008(+)
MSVLMSAMGCWVPYRSTRGMLTSSKNRIRRLPIAGPYVSFVRFSTMSSTDRCTSMEVVRLEKFMLRITFLVASRFIRYLAMVTVLAVPESPTNNTGLPAPQKVSSSQLERTVSTVGTRMEAKRPSSGGASGVTKDFQVTHLAFSTSKQYSYSDRAGSCDAGTDSPSAVEKPALDLRNLSKRSRSKKPSFCTTVAPTDHTMQNTKMASRIVLSVILRSSVSRHSSMLHSCVTRLRLVCGMVCTRLFVITSSSSPSRQKSTHL